MGETGTTHSKDFILILDSHPHKQVILTQFHKLAFLKYGPDEGDGTAAPSL